MKPAIILTVLLIIALSFQPIFAQEENLTAGELIAKGDSVFNSGNYEESREYYSKAVRIAEARGLNSELTEANAMLARSYLIIGQEDEGREYLAKAVETASTKAPQGWSRYLGVRGRFEWHKGQNEKATKTFKEMYEYCKAHELYSRAVDAAHMVAITGNKEEQIEWGLKGIEEAKKYDVQRWLGPLWNNLAWSYEDQEKYKESLDAYEQARQFHYEHGTPAQKLIADWAVAHAHRLVENYDQAEDILLPLVDGFEKLENQEFVGWTHRELGEIEFKRGNYHEAVRHLSIALRNLNAAGMKRWDNKGYYDIADLLEQAKINAEKEN